MQTPLWNEWHVEHVVTHSDGSTGHKIQVFIGGLIKYTWQVVAHRPDLVHLHTSADGSFVRKAVLFQIARLARIPVLLHMHSGLFKAFYDQAPKSVRKVIESTLEDAAVVVALGENWAERLREIAPRAAVTVVPNAVRAQAASKRPGPSEPVHVVFLGLICDAKGVFDLLSAWAMVTADSHGRSVRLTIAGSGETKRAEAEIARLGIASSVDIRSWLSPDAVQELLGSAQVLTLPSMNEGQPMAILEGMARGLCVVATAVGGVPEIVVDGTTGLLVQPADVEALATALRTVVVDDALRAQFGEAGLERIRTDFDADVIWRRMDQLYRSMLRSS